MAQVTSPRVLNAEIAKVVLAKNSAVAVAQSGDTTVLELNVSGLERLVVEVAVASKLLDAFSVLGAVHPDGSYMTLFSVAADFTSPAGLMVDASGDITTQAAGSSGWFVLDVRGLDRVKLTASSGDAAGSTVSVYATGR